MTCCLGTRSSKRKLALISVFLRGIAASSVIGAAVAFSCVVVGGYIDSLQPQYLWLEPVIIAAVVVFVIDLVGNTIAFSNRFLNALVTSVVFALVFGSLVWLR